MKAKIQNIEIEVGDEMLHSNRMAFFNVFNNDVEQKQEMGSFVQIVEGMKTFIDVGCSYGAFSLVFSSINKQHRGTSYAFDGSTKAITALKQTLSFNPDLLVIPKACLVGNKNDMVPCMFDEHQSLVGGNENLVKMVKIDTICQEYNLICDVIKVDTEGYEYNVLLGAEETIDMFKPVLFMEVHPRFIAAFYKQSIQDVYLFFQKHGYTAYGSDMNKIHDYYNHLTAEQTDSNRTIWVAD